MLQCGIWDSWDQIRMRPRNSGRRIAAIRAAVWRRTGRTPPHSSRLAFSQAKHGALIQVLVVAGMQILPPREEALLLTKPRLRLAGVDELQSQLGEAEAEAGGVGAPHPDVADREAVCRRRWTAYSGLKLRRRGGGGGGGGPCPLTTRVRGRRTHRRSTLRSSRTAPR